MPGHHRYIIKVQVCRIAAPECQTHLGWSLHAWSQDHATVLQV